MGAANLAAGFFQGFAVSTSSSRTAVAEQSGAKSQVTGVVGAGIVVVLLLFLNSLLADLPQTALAAVVIAAALSLMDLPVLRRYARVRRSRAGPLARRHRRGRAVRGARRHRHRDRPRDPVCSSAGAGGPTAPCSARRGRRRLAQPRDLPDAAEISRTSSCTAGRRRCSSPTPVRSASRSGALVRERQPSWVVLQCEAITDIDVTAAEMLEQLDLELNADRHPHRVRRAAHPAAGPHPTTTGSSRRSTATTSTRRWSAAVMAVATSGRWRRPPKDPQSERLRAGCADCPEGEGPSPDRRFRYIASATPRVGRATARISARTLGPKGKMPKSPRNPRSRRSPK